MRIRRRMLALACAVVVTLAAAACARRGEPQRQAMAGIVITPPIPKPDFTLTDTHGHPYNFRAETRGKVTLLFFGYTHCPDVCPLQMANVAAALKKAGPDVAKQVTVVFVTTDSVRDSPERLRQWLGSFDTTFVGLTGSLDRVNDIQARTRFLPRSVREEEGANYTVAHSAVMLAFARDDSAHVLYPSGVQPAAWAEDLKRMAAAAPPRANE